MSIRFQRPTTRLLFSSALFGVLIWMLLPAGVSVCDDDFAYLRSAVETIRLGRPWTYDWLNPWAASTSLLSAVVYRLTGSFQLAVHLVLAITSAAGFFGMARFIQSRGHGTWAAVSVAFFAMMSPAALFMSLIYTSMPVYMASLWFCLTAFAERRWGWFLVFFSAGLASRQSALVWLGLPAAMCLSVLLRRRGWRVTWMECSGPLATVAAGAMVFLFLKMVMNPTAGQEAIVQSIWSGYSIPARGVPLGASLVFLGMGFGISRLVGLPAGSRVNVIPVIAGVIAGALAGFWLTRVVVSTQWSDFFGAPDPYLIVAAAIAGGGIALRPGRPNPLYLFPAAGLTLLLCLYSGTYDYYFNELFCFGLAAGLVPRRDGMGTARVVMLPRPRIAAGIVGALMLLLALRTSICLKIQQDYTWASNRAYEMSIREGNLLPHQVGQATFGYLGWLWEEKYRLAHGYKSFTDLAGFRMWREHWNGKTGTGMIVVYPRWLTKMKLAKSLFPLKSANSLKKAAEMRVCYAESIPFLGLWSMDVWIGRVDTGRPSPVPGEDAPRRVYPLDDAEWAQLVRQEGPWAVGGDFR